MSTVLKTPIEMSKECSYYLSNFNHMSSSTNAAFGIKPSSEYPTGRLS